MILIYIKFHKPANLNHKKNYPEDVFRDDDRNEVSFSVLLGKWKSHATLTPLAKKDLPTFGYNMIDPLKSWCWGSILFYPFKISRFS